MQPDSPAELGNKIYEMMAMALGGRWGRLEDNDGVETEAAVDNAAEPEASSVEVTEAQVVEPSEVWVESESDPWND